jgi:hypothetical protein
MISLTQPDCLSLSLPSAKQLDPPRNMILTQSRCAYLMRKVPNQMWVRLVESSDTCLNLAQMALDSLSAPGEPVVTMPRTLSL